MALSKDVLKNALIQTLEGALKKKETTSGSPPNITTSVASSLADAYHIYASSATALPLATMVTPPAKAALAAALVAPLMAGWGPGLLSYWTPVTWAGPGFIPVNPTVPASLAAAAPAISALISSPIKPDSVSDFADKLATILHGCTIGLLVTATTTTAPPVVSIVKVS